MVTSSPLLTRFDLDEGPGDAELDAVARLAAAVCAVPTATVNLLDDVAQHQVATHGFAGAPSPREEAMCDVTVRQAEPVVLRDARDDARFAANPWVTGQRAAVRFYASHQLREPDGTVVGTLCVFDEQPRELTAQQQEALRELAAQTARLLEQRRAARALQEQLQLLGRANAELDAFAGRVAHDLKNPLTAVVGFLQLARHRAGDLPPLAGTYLDHAATAAGRLQVMLDGLLRFATSGSAAPVEGVDLDALLEHVRTDLSGVLAAPGTVLDVGPLGTATTDPVLLGQVLQNLLGNAVKYRRPGEPVHVAVRRSDTPDSVELSVADDGRGIPDEAKERVFELFRRAPNAGLEEGTGIGLATCARAVEALGGRITLSDTPGGGLTVTVHLPR